MDKLKQIPARFLEIWKSWSRNQKIIIVSAVAVFIAAVVVIAFVLSRPTYQELTRCEDYNEMNTVTSLLTDNGYTYQIDNMAVKVKEQDLTNAKMLIASNDIKPSGYSLDDALNSSLTTTESDKNKKYAKYLETKFENDITSLDGIKSASVTVHLSDDTNSFYSTKKDTTVAVTIDTNKTVGEDTAESIAVLLATAVGSSNTNGITIIDTSGKTLFNGADNSGSVSNIAYSSKLKYKSQIESTVAASVKNTALSTSLFNDATFEGDVYGMMMFLFDTKSAHHLVNTLMMQDTESGIEADTQFNDMEMSALNEIGNIVSGSYLTAISKLTNLKMVSTVPEMTIDMIGALLSVPASEFGKYGDKLLLIQSQFGELDFVNGYFLMIPELESYDKLLESLGV